MQWKLAQKKSSIMTNSTNNIGADIIMSGQMLAEVTGFKYLGTTLCKDGASTVKVCIRIASAMARLNMI